MSWPKILKNLLTKKEIDDLAKVGNIIKGYFEE